MLRGKLWLVTLAQFNTRRGCRVSANDVKVHNVFTFFASYHLFKLAVNTCSDDEHFQFSEKDVSLLRCSMLQAHNGEHTESTILTTAQVSPS